MKKKAAKGKAPARKLKAKAPKGRVGASKRPRTSAPARPRQAKLPGTEGPRSAALDRVCMSIADVRQQQNDLKGQENGLADRALGIMRNVGVEVYRAHGVELVRATGGEKLRVRLVKERSGDDVDDEDEPTRTVEDALEALPGGAGVETSDSELTH